MNTARIGNSADVRVTRHLEADGWCVGSRRHIGGPADLLAVKPGHRTRLIEVKATAKSRGTFADFRPVARRALSSLARRMDADALLAHWPPGGELEFIEEARWPATNGPRSRG